MQNTTLESVQFINFTRISELGNLTVFPVTDQGTQIPVKRIFTVSQVPPGHIRGNHAHRYCSQLVVCLNGLVEIELTDGTTFKSYDLKSPDFGILIPPGIWNKLRFEDENAVLMVLCDYLYDPADYIRNWDTFLKLKSEPI
jgi:dTDP-4-dehydrorhamnose 3,5-epimerase-like enzyme